MPQSTVEYQRAYRASHKDYFKTYRDSHKTYFTEKKNEWVKAHPTKGAEYVRKSQLWKSAVLSLLRIDVQNL